MRNILNLKWLNSCREFLTTTNSPTIIALNLWFIGDNWAFSKRGYSYSDIVWEWEWKGGDCAEKYVEFLTISILFSKAYFNS